MAWLRGSSDVANLASDIYNLLRGAIPAGSRGSGQAGNGSTVSGVDAWTGIDATNLVLRSQATEPMVAERPLWRGIPRIMWGTSGVVTNSAYPLTIGKPTFSGSYSGGTARGYYFVRVTTANTTAGTLAGTIVTYRFTDVNGTIITADTTVSGWTGTTDTRVLNNGISLTLTLTAGQQFIANATYWTRGYGTSYQQGVDYHPDCAKMTGAPVISNTSGGSNNYTFTTDYVLTQFVDSSPTTSSAVELGSYSLYGTGGEGVFSGIHWNTGGTPPAVGADYYIVSATLYSVYARVQFNNPAFFLTPMDFWDTTTARGRSILGSTTGAFNTAIAPNPNIFCNPFSASQSSATYINYWISVRRDKIIIHMRGDVAFTGTPGTGVLQKYTALDNVKDVHNWVWGGANASGVGSSMAFKAADWYYRQPNMGYSGFHPTEVSVSGAGQKTRWMFFNAASQSARIVLPSAAPTSNPVAWNDRWILYQPYLFENGGGRTTGGLYSEASENHFRGYLNGIYHLHSNGWTHLDELVDGAVTYLLINQGVFLNQLPANGTFAILQE